MTQPLRDPYDVLGVASNATLEEIKQSFRRNAALYHPDRNSSLDAAARFREVKQAYSLLADDARRESFDQKRQKQLLDDPDAVARSIWSTYLGAIAA
jgi:curved DNA-binding protein CbpA